jgi:hypothetical protein
MSAAGEAKARRARRRAIGRARNEGALTLLSSIEGTGAAQALAQKGMG